MKINVLDIIKGTTVDGPGFRTAIYLAGCRHKCPGCHNPQSHDPEGGTPMSIDEIMEIVRAEDFDVTLTGGDPLHTPDAAAALAKAIKSHGYNLWLYTGYTWEEIVADAKLAQVLAQVDVVVDGRFVESKKDPDLLFRGSSNQRLIDVAKSLKTGKPVEWKR